MNKINLYFLEFTAKM